MLQQTLRATERTLVLAALVGTRLLWRGLIVIANRERPRAVRPRGITP